MALFDDVLKGNILTGIAVGIGAAIFAPAVLPVLAGAVKPITKAVIKSGILLYEKSREGIAEAGEMMEDMIAEVKAELAEESRSAAETPAPQEMKAEA